MLAHILEQRSKVKQVLWSLTQALHSLNQRRHCQPFNSILNKLFHKLTFTFQRIFINILDKGIHQFLHIHDDLVQHRNTIILILLYLTHCQNNIHALVNVWHEGVGRVLTEVACEFAEGFEVGLVVEEMGVGENLFCALCGHGMVALEAFLDEADPFYGGFIRDDVHQLGKFLKVGFFMLL